MLLWQYTEMVVWYDVATQHSTVPDFWQLVRKIERINPRQMMMLVPISR